MEFPGFGHVALVVSDFDGCRAFYDKVMRHLGMQPYVGAPPFYYGWYADEYMFVIAHQAESGARFSQWRVGLHHLSFRARSRADVDAFGALLKDIGAKIVHPPEPGAFWPGYYSVLCEDPDGTRIEMNYIPKEGWDAVAAASRNMLEDEG